MCVALAVIRGNGWMGGSASVGAPRGGSRVGSTPPAARSVPTVTSPQRQPSGKRAAAQAPGSAQRGRGAGRRPRTWRHKRAATGGASGSDDIKPVGAAVVARRAVGAAAADQRRHPRPRIGADVYAVCGLRRHVHLRRQQDMGWPAVGAASWEGGEGRQPGQQLLSWQQRQRQKQRQNRRPHGRSGRRRSRSQQQRRQPAAAAQPPHLVRVGALLGQRQVVVVAVEPVVVKPEQDGKKGGTDLRVKAGRGQPGRPQRGVARKAPNPVAPPRARRASRGALQIPAHVPRLLPQAARPPPRPPTHPASESWLGLPTSCPPAAPGRCTHEGMRLFRGSRLPTALRRSCRSHVDT